MENVVNTPSKFAVFTEYEIKRITKGEPIEVHDGITYHTNGLIIQKATNEIKRWYNPILDTPELATELLKVDLSSEESIFKFVNDYGIPILISPDFRGLNRSYNDFDFELDVLTFYAFGQYLSDLKRITEIWKAIGDNNKEVLGYHVDRFKKFANEHKEFNLEWQKVMNKDDTTIVKSLLAMELNQLADWIPGFQLSGNQMIPSIVFTNLFQVALWQLSNEIIKENYFETCQNCGHVFLPQHGHQKFCPPRIGRKISTCQNTYNQRMKRKQKRARELKKEGLSAKEIANKMNESIENVLEWAF